MTPFTIFALVVTFGYVIYYAAIITIDLNSKPKTEGSQSETLDTNDILPDTGKDDTESSDEPSVDSDDESASVPVDTPIFPNGYSQNETYDEEDHSFEKQIPEDIIDNSQLDDNPYGLTDEDESLQGQQEQIQDDSPSEDLISSETEIPDKEDSQDQQGETNEPYVQIYEPEPKNKGLAVDINNSNEPITAESLTPCRPKFLATNVLDIMGIQRSFYGDQQSTLSNESPEDGDETTDIIDKI